jgi:hypothetical protein
MIKRTFADVKSELARVAGHAGMQTTDVRLREMVTIAQERLSVAGEWPYQYARLKFRQIGSLVCLPCEYEALVHSTVEREPIELQPSWFEFLDFGPGPTDQTKWANLGIDLGEVAVYRQPGTTGAVLNVTATEGADTGDVVVTGYDTNGVRKVVNYALPDATSTVRWSKVVQVTKPATLGDVVLSWEDDFAREQVAAVYRYRDKTPSFRSYRFPLLDTEDKIVHGIARRRLYPVTSDQDELFITNIAALRLAVKGVAFEDAGKIIEAETSFASAKKILTDEAARYQATKAAPPVNVTRIAALSTRPDIY